MWLAHRTPWPARPLLSCSYHAAKDIGPRLQRCRTVAELQPLLGELRDSGRLAQLAGSLARNPLSRAPPLPPPEPFSQVGHQRSLLASSCGCFAAFAGGWPSAAVGARVHRQRGAAAGMLQHACTTALRVRRTNLCARAMWPHPSPAVCAALCLQAAKARYKNVIQTSGQPTKPWRAVGVLRQGDAAKSMGVYPTAAQVCLQPGSQPAWLHRSWRPPGACHGRPGTAAAVLSPHAALPCPGLHALQAAAVADYGVVWREEVRGGERCTSQALLNFPRSG